MGFIQLVFLVVGVFGLVQLPKVKKAKAEDYPELPVIEFEKWKQHKLKAIKCYIWAGLGVLVFQILFMILFTLIFPGVDPDLSEIAVPVIANTMGFVALFIFGIIGAGHSDKAKKIAKMHNIAKMPR